MAKSNFEMKFLQEISDLDFFIIRKPIASPEFWSEWQEKYGKAVISKIALKKLLKSQKLDKKEMLKIKTSIKSYEEIIEYLERLKYTAFHLRGIYTGNTPNIETDEDMDIDF